jgi:hypothetical protein
MMEGSFSTEQLRIEGSLSFQEQDRTVPSLQNTHDGGLLSHRISQAGGFLSCRITHYGGLLSYRITQHGGFLSFSRITHVQDGFFLTEYTEWRTPFSQNNTGVGGFLSYVE